ncbi:hypothetical protein MAA_08021 [Metarhizium robertsii ARSEF 23]|uniref:Uncharacterized protein n=1 Tax=Metarhizium robertsii (strain ARSEF 23 / ATCC MYA-3075) TaxID=655844 RepID=E9F6X2_METRA|nr:uncharacterized protein MAA_08021 [Metarhizium robertsii ARSEF 23]EFY96524.2 hypothetical protein MAA_08021 [Metarhizium robertsii ARSEF 23]
MQPNDLLHIRSSAAGLPGPYLQENMAPYEILDKIGEAKPRTILLIQGHTERGDGFKGAMRFPYRKFAIALQRQGSNLVVMCNMHQQPGNAIPRIIAGPVPGNYCYHLVQQPPATMTDLAYRVYCDVFALFSDIVLISVADFGGLERVLSFVCSWVLRRQLQKPKLRTHFVVATDKYCLKDIQFELLATMMADQWTQSVASVKRTISDYTELSVINGSSASPGLVVKLFGLRNHRQAEGLHFTGSDTKILLRAAIAHYTAKPMETFNLVAASRPSWPVPEELGHHIGEFLAACPPEPVDHYPIIASALVMNAFHPGLHSFPPNLTFESLYVKNLAAFEQQAGCKGLTDRVRSAFVDIAKYTIGPAVEPRVQHLARLQGWRPISSVKLRATCSISTKSYYVCAEPAYGWTPQIGAGLPSTTAVQHGGEATTAWSKFFAGRLRVRLSREL